MKKIFWELLAVLGFWIPCGKLLPPQKGWDWVLISSKDKHNGFRRLPRIGEYSHNFKRWYTTNVDDDYCINNDSIVTHWHKIPGRKQFKYD